MAFCVAFHVGFLSMALPLDRVVRSVRIVAVTPLPHAPEIVCGVVNVQGRIVPVIDLRRRFGLPERELRLTDQLLIAHGATRMLAMAVESVDGVVACDEKDFVAVDSVVAGTRHVQGFVKGTDGLLLIHDIDGFLSQEEEHALNTALVPGPSASRS